MQVTLSAGIATLNPNETSDAVLARADKALYAAKAQGRNRIISS
jgi:diguanylate cyclase